MIIKNEGKLESSWVKISWVAIFVVRGLCKTVEDS